MHHEVIVGSTSNLTVDTDEVLGVTSNLKVLPDDSNLKMKFPTTDEDTSNSRRGTLDSKLEIKYFIDDEDMRSEILEDTSNLEVVTEYSIADEDFPHGVVIDMTSNFTVDTDEVLEGLLMIQNLKLNIPLLMKICIMK